MKCPHCGKEHSADAKFCEYTGKELKKACQNKDCADYGKAILPMAAKFCPRCGKALSGTQNGNHSDTPEPKPISKPNRGIIKIIAMVIVLTLVVAFVTIAVNNCSGGGEIEPMPMEETLSDSVIFTVKGVEFKMVKVEGGTFRMGATPEQGSDAYDWEKPVHSVTLSDYYIGETEVTQELWQAVMGSNPSYFKGNSQRPVENVSWDDCQEFIKKLNRLTGRSFRLPTEAEWEYAARGGKHGEKHVYKYSGSNNIDEVAWYWQNSGDKYLSGEWNGNRIDENNCKPHPVKTKKANELGLYDMSGNVWEWCNDWYGDYQSSPQTNSKGPATGEDRVLRGGSWNYDGGRVRVSDRGDILPDYRDGYDGLRHAL